MELPYLAGVVRGTGKTQTLKNTVFPQYYFNFKVHDFSLKPPFPAPLVIQFPVSLVDKYWNTDGQTNSFRWTVVGDMLTDLKLSQG